MTEFLMQEAQRSSPVSYLIFLVPLLFLFILMRSQKRKMQAQQARQQSAEIGDEIMTTGGIFGTIVDEDEDEGTVEVEIAPGTRIRMLRSGIARTLTEEYEDEDETYEDDEDVVDEDEGETTGDNARP
jgi:preprotein translocase subunit YajC